MIISLQNSLKFSDHEQKAFDEKEKLEMKKVIEKTASEYFKSSIFYWMIRSKYKTAFKSQSHSNRDNVLNLRKKLEEALYEKLDKKKEFKRKLQ